MKLLVLSTCLIFSFILPVSAEEKTFQGTVILYDQSNKFYSYGVMVAQNNILLPTFAFSPDIYQVTHFVYVDDFNERLNKTSLMYFQSHLPLKHRLPEGRSKQFIKLNNDFINLHAAIPSMGGNGPVVYRPGEVGYGPPPGQYGPPSVYGRYGPGGNGYGGNGGYGPTYDQPPPGQYYRPPPPSFIPGREVIVSETENSRVAKLSRYSLCTNESALYTISNPASDGVQFLKPVEFKTFTDEECAEIFPKYNPKTQICGPSTGLRKYGTPLFETIDSINYFVGFPAENQSSDVSLYNLLNEKCSNFPTYEICDPMRSFTSHFVPCNSIQTAQKLKTSGHPEVVLVGTNVVGDFGSFVPLGLGVVISDDKLMVFSDVKKYIENYRFYGYDNNIELTIMSQNIHGEEYEYVVFDDNDNTTSTTQAPKASAESNTMFKLLKFKNPVFNKLPKAKIVIDETITDRKAPSPLEGFDNLMVPAFDEKTGEFLAIHAGNTTVLNLDDSFKKIIIEA